MILFKRIFGIITILLGALFFSIGIAVIIDKSQDEAGTGFGIICVGLIPLLFGVWLVRNSRTQLQHEKSKNLDQAFYELLKNGHATIADFDFAVQNKISRQEAREFLEKKCMELGASADANDKGMVVYIFGE